jgi:hypothetical protein
MGARKIVDLNEIKGWFEEGWTYQEMSAEYLRKYNVEMVPSGFSNIRNRYGWVRRISRNDDLIPWHVLPEHRHAYPIRMLRAEARRRGGFPLREVDEKNLPPWLDGLNKRGEVVHYDPELDAGFVLVPREPTDTDIIREPARKTTLRKSSD